MRPSHTIFVMSTNNSNMHYLIEPLRQGLVLLTIEQLADTFAAASGDVNSAYLREDLRYDSTHPVYDIAVGGDPYELYQGMLSTAYRGIITQELLDAYCADAEAVLRGRELGMLFDAFEELDHELMRLTLRYMVKAGVLNAACLTDEDAYYLG